MLKNLTIKQKILSLIMGIILSMGVIVGYAYDSNKKTMNDIRELNDKDLKLFLSIQNIKLKVFSIKDKSYSFIGQSELDDKKANKFIENIKKYKNDIEISIGSELKENKGLSKKEMEILKKVKDLRMSALISSASEMAYTYVDKESDNDDRIFDFQTFQTNATLVSNELNKLNDLINKKLSTKTKEMEVKIEKSTKIGFIITIIAVLVLIIYSLFIFKTIIGPLNKMQEGLFQFFSFLNKTVENAEPIDLDTNDELGIMVKEINKAIEKIKVDMLKDDRMITNASEVMSRMKTGYFDTFVEEEPSDNNLNKLKTEVNQLIEDMQNKIGKNLNVVLQVIESYSTLNFTVNIEDADSLLEERLNKLGLEISNMLNDNLNIGQQLEQKSDVLKESFDELSIASNKQAASLEETAASIEEITGNIRGNTDKAEKMTQLANQAKSTAEDGETLIIKNTKSMEEIDESTKRIDEAILQIEQIAFQTNILSLNAAVEAATAGEHGKGFAVVASEVRNLASKSADVAKEIKLLVVKATERTSEGRQISGQIKEAFGELIIKISETAELVGEVAEANKEQLTGMVQISETSSTLDITTQENVKIVTQTDIITKELFEMATKIVTEVKKKKFIEYSGE